MEKIDWEKIGVVPTAANVLISISGSSILHILVCNMYIRTVKTI